MCFCKPLSIKRNETEQINIKFGDQAIKKTDSIKLLGVNFTTIWFLANILANYAKRPVKVWASLPG